MTAKEKREVATLVRAACDHVTAAAKAWPGDDAPGWHKKLYWEEVLPERHALQDRIKEMTGEHVDF